MSNPLGITQFGAFTLETAQLIALSGNGRLIQTARVQHTVTSTDQTNMEIPIAVTYQNAFADTNYTVIPGVTLVSGSGQPTGYYVNAMGSKATTGVTVSVGVNAPPYAVVGDVIAVEVIAIHD